MTKPTAMSKAISTQKTYPCPNCQKPTVWQDNPYSHFVVIAAN